MVNLLRNSPNGGVPVMARKPAIQSTPVTGAALNSPRTCAMFLVW